MNIEEIKKALVQIQGECFLPITDKEDISTMIEELLYLINEDD